MVGHQKNPDAANKEQVEGEEGQKNNKRLDVASMNTKPNPGAPVVVHEGATTKPVAVTDAVSLVPTSLTSSAALTATTLQVDIHLHYGGVGGKAGILEASTAERPGGIVPKLVQRPKQREHKTKPEEAKGDDDTHAETKLARGVGEQWAVARALFRLDEPVRN